MRHALDFAVRVPGWHTYTLDRATRSAIRSLEHRGLVEVNDHRQFRAVAVTYEIMVNSTPTGVMYSTLEKAEEMVDHLRHHCDPRCLYEARPRRRT